VFIQNKAHPNPDLFNDIYPKYELFLNLMGFNESYLDNGGLYELNEQMNDMFIYDSKGAYEKKNRPTRYLHCVIKDIR